MAENLKWPREHWTLLLQSVVIGKAREIYTQLSLEQSSDYDKVKELILKAYRPLAGYGLPPPRGNFVDHIFLEAQYLARILQHVSPLTLAALSCNSLLHTLPYKIFDNQNSF